jgi:hypothetical protein
MLCSLRMVRELGGWGVGSWTAGRVEDETLFPLTLTLASSELVLLTSKVRPRPVHPSHTRVVVTSFSVFAGACLLYHNGTRHYYAFPTSGHHQVSKLASCPGNHYEINAYS